MGNESLIRPGTWSLRAPASSLPGPSPAVRIDLFGDLSLQVPDGRIELPGLKTRALLAYLAISPGAPIQRGKLAALLWGDVGERQARDSLKQAVWTLRRVFAQAGEAVIRSDRLNLALSSESVVVDVVSFTTLLAEGTLGAREQAIPLYRGDLLEGLEIRAPAFEDWLLVERQRLRRMATEALEASLEDALAAGSRDLAALRAQHLLSLDPFHEKACRAMMRIHADRSQRAQALKLFETLRQKLREEFGVRPEADTLALYESIRGGSAVPASAARPVAPQDVASRPAVAVLPFANIGGDPEQDYFANGLTEDIVTDLSYLPDLIVVARQGAPHASPASPLDVAQAPGVGYLLKGSIRKDGRRVRVAAQLVDASTSFQLWAERYDRDVGDIFMVQAEIARRIADVLRIKLLPDGDSTSSIRTTESAEAYQLYLLGRSFFLKGLDKRTLRIARDFFVKARAIDPHYARAFAATAICDAHLCGSEPTSTLENIEADSRQAVALAPDLADAHIARGLASYVAGRYGDAATAFDRAIVLDPHLFEAHFYRARCSLLLGSREKAVEQFESASKLRPGDFRTLGLLSDEYRALGRDAEYRATATYCLQCLSEEVKSHPENADAWAFGSAMLAASGESARAREWATRAIIIGPDDHLVHYNVSRTFALLGEPDCSLDWLERALSAQSVFRRRLVAWIPFDQDLDLVRNHPRYQALWRTCAGDP